MTKTKKKSPNVGAPFKSPMIEFSINGPSISLNNNCINITESTKPRQSICSLENLDLSGLFANNNLNTSKGHRGTKRVVLEEADAKNLNNATVS